KLRLNGAFPIRRLEDTALLCQEDCLMGVAWSLHSEAFTLDWASERLHNAAMCARSGAIVLTKCNPPLVTAANWLRPRLLTALQDDGWAVHDNTGGPEGLATRTGQEAFRHQSEFRAEVGLPGVQSLHNRRLRPLRQVDVPERAVSREPRVALTLFEFL